MMSTVGLALRREVIGGRESSEFAVSLISMTIMLGITE